GKPEEEKKSVGYYSAFYQNSELNSFFVEDGSYLKLREVSLYYKWKLKDAMMNGLVKSIRFGVIGRNMITFSNYSGYDPEVSSGSDLSNYAFDNFGYPNFRTISGSVQFVF
ncbi:MAG: hypothetical protein U9R19_02150, partial [Bacteroidota bacterium]|nr:hypothetical protein [Bacteroidota bacterium]